VGTTTDKTELLRKLPSVDAILRSPALEVVIAREGQTAVADAARTVLARIREEVLSARLDDNEVSLAVSGLAEAVERQMRANIAYSLRMVINATGVILHTNLGRAPLGATALEHIREVAGTYSNLEFDVAAGERGKRDVHVDRLFAQLLGDAGRDVSTVVVNNNAAAVLIALNTLAEGGEVIVSRGELVEIGGSFRVPDVMAKSGATLREVGTTNRTRSADYENAITDKTRLLMRVHRSNFEMVGFTEQPSLDELVEVGRKHRIPVLEDVGSGAFFDLRHVNVHGEQTILDSIRAGVDVVTYSGDKLLGGPQAGIISGTRELVAKIRKNPLFRALRVDKLTYAALEGTMLAYVKQDYDAIPAIRMVRVSTEELESRAETVREKIVGAQLTAEIVESESVIGGGAAPTATLPTRALTIKSSNLNSDEIAERLRRNDPPIVARVEDNRVLLDLRTVFPEQDELVARALLALKI
jgi:L-seryl-tRNA(Ser) seleniumtransferase